MEINRVADCSLEFEDALHLYRDASTERYNFFYMDRRNDDFRTQNFDKRYVEIAERSRRCR